MVKILGIDPGLRYTGWGIITKEGSHIKHIANGTISTSKNTKDLSFRLKEIYVGIYNIIKTYHPEEASIEETFVNQNPKSTLKLGQARGVALLTPALFEIPVFEYSPNIIKKAVVGTGHAKKEQIEAMVKILLGGIKPDSEHSADALAIAICHTNHRNFNKL